MRVPMWRHLLFVLGLWPSLSGTTIIPPTFDELVGQSDYVVRVVITSVAPERRPSVDHPGSTYIMSRVAVETREVLKGQPPSPLVLEMLGGKIGDEQLVVQGAPRLAVGEEHILFVRGNSRVISPFVGLGHGAYRIERDPQSGADRVLRANGRPLYHESEISSSLELTASALRLPVARPLSVAEFASRIREVAARLPHDASVR